MRAHRKIGRKRALGATSLWDACYEPYGHRRTRVSPRTRILLTFITIMAIIGLLLIVANPKPVLSQGVQLIQVDVNVVAHGYRVLGNEPAGLFYHTTEVYDPSDPDELRIPHDDPRIGFDWRTKPR